MNSEEDKLRYFSLFEEFYFSCSLKVIDITKPRSEICIHFLNSEKIDNRESDSAFFSFCIMAMIWLVLELLINLQRHYLNYLPYNGQPFIFLSINSLSLLQFFRCCLSCPLLFITAEGMRNIEQLGEIKGFIHAKFIAMKSLNIY